MSKKKVIVIKSLKREKVYFGNEYKTLLKVFFSSIGVFLSLGRIMFSSIREFPGILENYNTISRMHFHIKMKK